MWQKAMGIKAKIRTEGWPTTGDLVVLKGLSGYCLVCPLTHVDVPAVFSVSDRPTAYQPRGWHPEDLARS